MYHYYLNQKHRTMPYFEPKPDHPITYEGVRDLILEKAVTSPVFFKDMAYYIDSDMLTDDLFCKSVTHCFLIRSPQAAIASYYQLDSAVTLAEIGIEAQWRVYSHLVGLGVSPVVIQAESIRKAPRTYCENWWNTLGLENKDSAFNWRSEPPEDWEQVKQWHQNVILSTSIHPWSEQDRKNETDSFEAAASGAPHLRSYLAHHKVFFPDTQYVYLYSSVRCGGSTCCIYSKVKQTFDMKLIL